MFVGVWSLIFIEYQKLGVIFRRSIIIHINGGITKKNRVDGWVTL